MRTFVVVVVVLAMAGGLLSDPPAEPIDERVARLVKQLGHKEFAKREAASKELDAIGEPALKALRKAATDDDAEIRQRAAKIVGDITGRIRAAAAKKELEKLQGTWYMVSIDSGGMVYPKAQRSGVGRRHDHDRGRYRQPEADRIHLRPRPAQGHSRPLHLDTRRRQPPDLFGPRQQPTDGVLGQIRLPPRHQARQEWAQGCLYFLSRNSICEIK